MTAPLVTNNHNTRESGGDEQFLAENPPHHQLKNSTGQLSGSRSFENMPHEIINLHRATGESLSSYPISEQPYFEVKCYCKKVEPNATKVKGVCTIKAEYLTFRNDKDFSHPLFINIFDILAVEPIHSKSKFTTQHVKITTPKAAFIFMEWPSYIKQFFFVYVQREQLLVSNQQMTGRVSKTLSLASLESDPADNVTTSNNTNNNIQTNDRKMNENENNFLSSSTISQNHSWYNKILSNLKIDYTLIFEKELPLTINQTFNLLKGNNKLANQFKAEFGDEDLEITDWHVDVEGNVVVDMSFKTSIKLMKNIKTFAKSLLQYPYIENQLLFIKDNAVVNTIGSTKLSITCFHLLGNNSDNKATNLAVYCLVESHGSVLPTGIFKGKTIKTFISRYKAWEEFVIKHKSEIDADESLNDLAIKNIPSKYIPEEHDFSDCKIDLKPEIVVSTPAMEQNDNGDDLSRFKLNSNRSMTNSSPDPMCNFIYYVFWMAISAFIFYYLMRGMFSRVTTNNLHANSNIEMRLDGLENSLKEISDKVDEILATKNS